METTSELRRGDAAKHDEGKARFDLIPPRALWNLAEVYTIGEKKYSARNWEKGMPWGRIFAAVMRHLWKFWSGEDVDPEDGMSHLVHAAWGCFALIEYAQTHREMDDRPATSNVPANRVMTQEMRHE
jgi:hypothetical protein